LRRQLIDLVLGCEVLEVEPERRWKYRFATGSLETTITWELVPERYGTRLKLTHEGFNLDSPLRRRALEGMRPDSPRVLDLGDFLMGTARRTSDKASSILALSPNPKRKGGIQHRVSEIRAPTLRRNQIAGTTTLAAMTYRVARPVTELMQPRK
jgi:hypothetical protein